MSEDKTSTEEPTEVKQEKANNENGQNDAGSSWFTPWISAVKSKSSEVLEFVKKDLEEISNIVSNETSSVVNSTTSAIKNTLKTFEEPESTANTVKRSFSSFLDNLNNAFNPPPDDECQEALQIQNDVPVPISHLQVKICELIKNPETFTQEIDQSQSQQFEAWLGIADDQMTMDKLTKQLVASPDLHTQYETLVPEQVSHIAFWRRFLFRKALLEDEESFREAREKREQQQAEKLQWEKEDFAQGVDLTEEEQIKILTDYENEKKTKKVKDDVKSDTEQLVMHEKQGMVIVGDTSLASSSSADTEGEWEKDFEIKEEDKW